MTIFTFPGVQISTAGLATETEQQAQTALLTTIDADTGSISTSAASIDGKTPALGQALAAGSVPVVLTAAQVSTLTPQTDALTDTQLRATAVPVSGPLTDVQLRASAVPVSAASLPLPTDAATQTTLAALNAKVTAVNTGAVVVSSSALPTGAATEVTLASIDSKITAVNTGAVTISAALPAGTNTIGAVNQAGTWTVQPGNTANTTPWLVTQAGKTAVDKVRNDYTSTSVTTSAYVQLVASLTSACTEIEIFDSSGQTLVLATGASSSEVEKIYITPGGNGRIPLAIAASTRVSIKAVSATASAGEIVINFYG